MENCDVCGQEIGEIGKDYSLVERDGKSFKLCTAGKHHIAEIDLIIVSHKLLKIHQELAELLASMGRR